MQWHAGFKLYWNLRAVIIETGLYKILWYQAWSEGLFCILLKFLAHMHSRGALEHQIRSSHSYLITHVVSSCRYSYRAETLNIHSVPPTVALLSSPSWNSTRISLDIIMQILVSVHTIPTMSDRSGLLFMCKRLRSAILKNVWFPFMPCPSYSCFNPPLLMPQLHVIE